MLSSELRLEDLVELVFVVALDATVGETGSNRPKPGDITGEGARGKVGLRRLLGPGSGDRLGKRSGPRRGGDILGWRAGRRRGGDGLSSRNDLRRRTGSPKSSKGLLLARASLGRTAGRSVGRSLPKP